MDNTVLIELVARTNEVHVMAWALGQIVKRPNSQKRIAKVLIKHSKEERVNWILGYRERRR